MPTIVDLQSAYRSGRQRPSQVIEGFLDAIERSELNSFVSVDREHALAAARQADEVQQQGGDLPALHGMPIAIKDLIDVAGMRTTMGSEQYAHHVAQQHAEVVSRLLAAGAIVIGKANTHQFAYGSTGDRSFFGAVHNPHNPGHMPGGSSSGSAAAVGGDLCVGALGTDTSASVRLPGALCGVVGMKPTYDLLPRTGVFPLSHTLDHVGPLTKTVRDNAILLEVLANAQAGTYTRHIGQSIEGRVVGVPVEFFRGYLSPEVSAELDRARAAFEAAGAKVVEIDIDGIWDIYNAQQTVLKAEAYAVHREALQAEAPYHPEIRTRLLGGESVSDDEYNQALGVQKHARQAFDAALASVDVLLTATCGVVAPPLEERETLLGSEKYSTPWLLTRLTAPTNLSGHPSVSVPFGASNGLPIGMQIIGQHRDEAVVYQYAAVLEAANRTQEAV